MKKNNLGILAFYKARLFKYHIGVLISLLSIGAVIVFVIEVIIMNLQVKKEEQRLKADFGSEYEEYVRNSNRFMPKLK